LIEIWSLSTKELNSVENYLGGIVETVDNNDFVTMLKEGQSGE